jgi:hypothetical protein
MRRGFSTAAAVISAFLLLGAAQASAAEEIGDRCVANDGEAGSTAIVMNNGAGGPFPPELANPEHSGVIVRWKTTLEPGVGPLQQQLLAFQQTGEQEVRKIGESAVETVVDGTNEFATRIPVPPYARIGLDGPVETLFCKAEGHIAGIVEDPFALGEVRKVEYKVNSGSPALAFIERDADVDGYGDETQDQCWGMFAYHEGCPAITVSAGKAKVSKPAISVPVSIESPTPLSFPGQVRITGQVTPGKGAKPVFLSNYGYQNVSPGSPLTIDVALPNPVRKRLDRLNRKASLKAKLSIGLDNAAAFAQPPPTELTVKLPGRKKPRHHHKR